ncbi:MAG: hypothetical protein M1826_006670 [Phylliscum demangeonii]|nr:MAG: hypothetical protein M1826_006670 [Phylliscum demangeonii]
MPWSAAGIGAGAHQTRQNYRYRMPSPPDRIVPVWNCVDDFPANFVAHPRPRGDLGPGARLPARLHHALEPIGFEYIQRVASQRWRYEDRRVAQQILPFLYLGPASAARDEPFLTREGITMTLAVRSAMMAQAGLLDNSRMASKLGMLFQSVDIVHGSDLLPAFGRATGTINAHLTAAHHAQASRTGKVLVYCESGNHPSAAVVAAYLMTMYDVTIVPALQLVHVCRFSVIYDEPMKHLLSTYEELLAAQRDVTRVLNEGGVESEDDGSNGAGRCHDPNRTIATRPKRGLAEVDEDDWQAEMVMAGLHRGGVDHRQGVAPFIPDRLRPPVVEYNPNLPPARFPSLDAVVHHRPGWSPEPAVVVDELDLDRAPVVEKEEEVKEEEEEEEEEDEALEHERALEVVIGTAERSRWLQETRAAAAQAGPDSLRPSPPLLPPSWDEVSESLQLTILDAFAAIQGERLNMDDLHRLTEFLALNSAQVDRLFNLMRRRAQLDAAEGDLIARFQSEVSRRLLTQGLGRCTRSHDAFRELLDTYLFAPDPNIDPDLDPDLGQAMLLRQTATVAELAVARRFLTGLGFDPALLLGDWIDAGQFVAVPADLLRRPSAVVRLLLAGYAPADPPRLPLSPLSSEIMSPLGVTPGMQRRPMKRLLPAAFPAAARLQPLVPTVTTITVTTAAATTTTVDCGGATDTASGADGSAGAAADVEAEAEADVLDSQRRTRVRPTQLHCPPAAEADLLHPEPKRTNQAAAAAAVAVAAAAARSWESLTLSPSLSGQTAPPSSSGLASSLPRVRNTVNLASLRAEINAHKKSSAPPSDPAEPPLQQPLQEHVMPTSSSATVPFNATTRRAAAAAGSAHRAALLANRGGVNGPASNMSPPSSPAILTTTTADHIAAAPRPAGVPARSSSSAGRRVVAEFTMRTRAMDGVRKKKVPKD